MPRKCQRPGLPPGRSGDCSDNEIVAQDTVTPAEKQASSAALVELHVTLVREQLRLHGQIPLTLTSDDRWRWGQRGLTLKERDFAAGRLVAWGEAEYRILKDRRHPYDNAVHLVPAPAQEGDR